MSGNPKKQAEVSYYSSVGLKYEEVADNGNCLYDAVAKALNTSGRPYTNTELMAQRQQLRNQISQYLNTSIFVARNPKIIEAVNTVLQAKLLEQYQKDLEAKQSLISSGYLTGAQIMGVQREIAALNKRLGDGINPTPQEIQKYLESVRTTEWGDQLAIQALSKCLRRPIIIVTSNPTSTISVTKIGEENTTNPPIFVPFNGINHYDALIIQPGHNSNTILQSLLRFEQQQRSKATDKHTGSSPTTSSPSTTSTSTSTIGNSSYSSFEFDEHGTVARGKSLIQPKETTSGGRIGTSSSEAQKAMWRLMDSPENRTRAHRKFLRKGELALRKEALNRKIEIESAKRPQTAPSKPPTSIATSSSVRPIPFRDIRDKPLTNNYMLTPHSEPTGKAAPQSTPIPTPSNDKTSANHMHEFPTRGVVKIKPEQPTHIPVVTPLIPRSGYSSDKKPPQRKR